MLSRGLCKCESRQITTITGGRWVLRLLRREQRSRAILSARLEGSARCPVKFLQPYISLAMLVVHREPKIGLLTWLVRRNQYSETLLTGAFQGAVENHRIRYLIGARVVAVFRTR